MTELDNTIGIFDKYASQYQEKYMAHAPYVGTYDYLVNLVAEGANILDVACGPANISKYLYDRIAKLKITGCDLSAQMIRLAKLNLPDGKFELRDSRDIDSMAATFDVVISGFALPYLSQLEAKKFIVDARARLNSGGLLYLSTMEGSYEDSGYPEHATGDNIFIYYHDADFLLQHLSENNFEVVHLQRTPFVENGVTTATDLFIYAKAI